MVSDHDGRGVVCPTCHSMLRLPAKGEETPPLVVKELSRRRRSHGDRRREQRAEAIFDETFADKSGPDPIFSRILIASVVTIAIVIVAGILWPRAGGPAVDPEPVSLEPPSADIQPLPDAGPRVVSVAMVRDELEPVVRAFLEAPDLKTASEWTARSERTLERMKAHYGDDYRPEGLESVLWNHSMTMGGGWASFEVETRDFNRRPVFLVDDGGWKIDWESWVGWSPMTWEQLVEQRPTGTVRLRAVVRPVEYYNFRFSSESEWAAFTLASPDNASAIYGYVPRGSELHSRLTFLDGTTERRLLLDVRYPRNAPVGNQVLIEGLTGESWLDLDDLP